ncbi:NLR family, CARD domain containing 5 [Nematolebias whitei]|uniref:NLR family, CARD domain containing 5 n=1 Tax=Nematolebias whitei TaxID=451745 RepID=UPI001897F977|nr:NLR family, CARD domain containing 5 [Nematolebias whitei]
MDDELDPADENVNSVLAQESSELFEILCSQSQTTLMSLWETTPPDAGRLGSAAASALVPEHISAMLEHFRRSRAAECCSFLQRVCLLCDNVPMHLESKLMSVAGNPFSVRQNPTLSETGQRSPAEEQLVKRPRIDHWEQHVKAAAGFLQRRWERLSAGRLRDLQPEKVWVSLRTTSRTRERADQTPGSAERGSRTPEPDVDYGSLESRLTLETFLQGCAGKVTVLCGPAGSGKTLLTSCLGHQCASGLGPIPSSYLFVLLEFRQLNLLSSPLSLSELLFQHYLPPQNGDSQAKKAVMDYLLSNPEQSCWVLDGYDEFHRKLSRRDEPLDPETPVPAADLVSGLVSRQLLPGSTVLLTCRVRDVSDLDGLADKVGQLLPWDHQEIREYVDSFFGVKDGSPGSEAADLLFSSRHLLAMSSLPALCNICCVFLQHLLQEKRRKASTNPLETRDKGAQNPDVRQEEDGHGDSSRGQRTDPNRAETSSSSAEVPPTRTQLYLAVVSAFLSRRPHEGGGEDPTNTSTFPHSVQLCGLSRLAWQGLEKSSILFLKNEVPPKVLELSVRTGLFSQVEVRGQDGKLLSAYSFTHLTLQEFLAALRIMTSNDVSDAQLKKRFSLKTRWTTRSDQKTVFTDSLYLYVCGLASSRCTQAVVQVARASGLKGVQSWVQKRQDLVLNLLKALCHNNTLTGPKVLQLCHYVQESQNQQLAHQVVSVRPTLELRNFWLLPNDIHALAFVANSAGDDGVGLDFGSCSMELECLDILTTCRNIHHLSFHSRKYGDKFAGKLSTIVPEFTTLRKLQFCGSSLTAAGAASLASGLQNCPSISELNFSDNNLQDEGIQHIAEIFTKLPNLTSVTLGRNNTSLKAVGCLVDKMSSCLNIQRVHADGVKELTVTFCQGSDINSHKVNPEPAVSLLNQKWTNSEMEKLVQSLANCPALSVLNLSGGYWDEQTLKTLTEFVPKFSVSEKIILNGSCSSVEGLVVLTALLSERLSLFELNVRLQSPVLVCVVFPGGREKPAAETSKKLCLSCCDLQPSDLDRVLRSLGSSPGLTDLDLSCNRLGDKGLKKLLDILPRLKKLREVHVGDNWLSMDGAVLLAAALCSNNNLTETHISEGGKNLVTLRFSPETSDDKLQIKLFRITNSSLLPSDVTRICNKLLQSRSYLELEFSHCSFSEETIENLLRVLPKMLLLRRLNVSCSISSTADALMLISCLTDGRRVSSVELSPQSESFITFDGVQAEQVNCRFTGFCFKGDDIVLMNRLLQILQHNQQLSYLDLSEDQLDDDGVKRLVDSLPKLHISSYMNLSKNRLSQRGLLDVVGTLCTCASVSEVDVSLGEEQRCLVWFGRNRGAGQTLRVSKSSLEHHHLLRLAEILLKCPTLTRLQLQNNGLQSDWIQNFVKVLNRGQRGRSFSVEESWIRAEEAVDLVSRCLEVNRSIHAIRIQQNTLHVTLKNPEPTSSRREAERPAQFMATSLSLVDCSAHGTQLAALKNVLLQSPSLTQLDFSDNTLGPDGAEFLSLLLPLLPNLTTFSVATKERSESVVEELAPVFLQSTSIQCLNLSGHLISGAAAQSLARLLPRLRSLNLSRCVWSAEGGRRLVEALKLCRRLEDLCLDAASQLDRNSWVCLAQAVRNITSVRSLRLNEIVQTSGTSEVDIVLDLLAGLEGLTQMRQIELDGWRMAEKGTEQLIAVLPNWKELRKISLSKNLISDPSGEKLLDALRSCGLLEELHLSSNRLGDASAARMALTLPSLTHLTVLDISENQIGKEGSASLSEAITSLKNLKKIHLTSVGTSELSDVVASLAHCALIQDVGLGWNNCGDDVALQLTKLLPFCLQLTRIDLECNSVSVSGVEALEGAMKSCPALQLIRLWRNRVSVREAQSFSLRERRLNFSSTIM